MSDSFRCRTGDRDTTLALDTDGLTLGERHVDWLDVDDVRYVPHGVDLVLGDGEVVAVRGLGARSDECGARVRVLRGERRRPALTQAALAPVAAFESRSVTPGEPAPAITDVLLFPHAVVVEPRGGAATHMPLPLVAGVDRDGHAFVLRGRGVPDTVVRGLGARTDEFGAKLAECRTALAAATRAAYAAVDERLVGVDAPDGWAVGPALAGPHWDVLRSVWLSRRRAQEAERLAAAVGEQGLRLGLWSEGGTSALPFLLAARQAGDRLRVAVEAVDADDRATFVFEVDDVDRLNAALVLTAFRREALVLPEAGLGRWAPAVRTQPAVRWAREHLVARVVHDGGWDAALTAALG